MHDYISLYLSLPEFVSIFSNRFLRLQTGGEVTIAALCKDVWIQHQAVMKWQYSLGLAHPQTVLRPPKACRNNSDYKKIWGQICAVLLFHKWLLFGVKSIHQESREDRWPELLTVLSMLVYAKNNTDFFSSLFCDLDCTLSMRIKLEEFP